MRYWLMKSEPGECSIDDVLAMPAATIPWTGVRNYQARNFMRDLMRVGDGVLFYHSSCPQPGIVGFARVVSAPYPDPMQFDPASPYFDASAEPQAPRWVLVDVQVRAKTHLMSISQMRAHPALEHMAALRRGNRLSITPVAAAEWSFLSRMLMTG